MPSLAVHFKGFDNLFANRGLSKAETDELIEAVAQEFVQRIRKEAVLRSVQLTLVWDGDDFHAEQWTLILVRVLEMITDDYNDITLLTCKEIGGWGAKSRGAYLEQLKSAHSFGAKMLQKHQFHVHTYGAGSSFTNLNINNSTPADYTTVGMYLLYKTSLSCDRVIVLCAGGGAIVLREYEYTKGNYTNFPMKMRMDTVAIPMSEEQRGKVKWFLTSFQELHHRKVAGKPDEHTLFGTKDYPIMIV